MRFPSSPENFTPEWLSHELGASVSAFEIEQIGIGVGLLGRLFRLTLTSDGGPPSVVAKVPTFGCRRTDVRRRATPLLREGGSLLPRAVGGRPDRDPEGLLRRARCGDRRNFTLLLEDLGDRRMEDQIVGCTARTQRRRWMRSSTCTRTGGTAGLPRVVADVLRPAVPTGDRRDVQAVLARARWRSSKDISPPNTWSSESVSPNSSRGSSTTWLVARSRFATATFAWTTCSSGRRTEHAPVAAVDWQICSAVGPPTTSPTSSARASTPRSAASASRCCATGTSRDWRSAVRSTTRRQFLEDYRRTVAYCFIYAVVTAGQIEMANERQRELVLGIGDRAVQAMEDNDRVGSAAELIAAVSDGRP